LEGKAWDGFRWVYLQWQLSSLRQFYIAFVGLAQGGEMVDIWVSSSIGHDWYYFDHTSAVIPR
jgi:hypothetical protein